MPQAPVKQPLPVRVLINAVHARAGGGVTYLQNLLARLAGDARLDLHLLIAREQRPLLGSIDPRITVEAHDLPRGAALLLWEQLRLPGIARSLGARVTFSLANYGPLLAPRPVVLLCNALAVGRYERRFPNRLYWWALALMTGAALLTCRRAVAVSDYARRAMTRGPVRLARAKVAVVYHGIDPAFGPGTEVAASRDGGPFLLAVGDLYIQKNFEVLVEALARLHRSHPALRLLIAGRAVDPDYAARLHGTIERLGLSDRVSLLGWIDRAALIDLYRRCAVFAFPSLAEAFGQPMLEAMACGAAVICADATAMPELADGAALTCAADDADGWAESIARVIDDPVLSHELRHRGLCRAAVFSWEDAARRTADVLCAAAA